MPVDSSPTRARHNEMLTFVPVRIARPNLDLPPLLLVVAMKAARLVGATEAAAAAAGDLGAAVTVALSQVAVDGKYSSITFVIPSACLHC